MSRQLSVQKRQAPQFIRETADLPQKPLGEISSFRPGFTQTWTWRKEENNNQPTRRRGGDEGRDK
jgi:hypothetical protein